MNDSLFLSKHVDHIPVIWAEPENLTEPADLVIWLDWLTGDKERMKPYLADLATSGFVALSFDAFQHGERANERPEQFISRIAANYRHHYWPILGQTILDTTRIIDWAVANLKVSPRCADRWNLYGRRCVDCNCWDRSTNKVCRGNTCDARLATTGNEGLH